MFVLDILVNFRTTVIDDYGNELLEQMEIAKSYLAGAFTIDLLATIPFDVIIPLFVEINNNYS